MLDFVILNKIKQNDPDLAMLDFNFHQLTDLNISQICQALKKNTYVNTLLLNNCPLITEKSVVEIAGLLRINNILQRVELARNPQLSDECLNDLLYQFKNRFYNNTGFARLSLNPHRNLQLVDEVDSISANEFMDLYCLPQRPLIVKGAIKDTLAFKHWSPKYFADIIPEKEVKLFLSNLQIKFTEHDSADFYIAQVPTDVPKMPSFMVKMREAASLIENPANSNSLSVRFYMADFDLNTLPEIQKQIEVPDFANKIEHVRRSESIWFGQKDTYSHPHYDVYNNIYLQVYGEKTFLLYSPEDSKYLFQFQPKPGRMNSDYHASKILNIDILDDKTSTTKLATPFQARLCPGDVLFLPRCWWHDVRGNADTPTISVNYWFYDKRERISAVDELIDSIWPVIHASNVEEVILDCVAILLQLDKPNYVTMSYYNILQCAIFFHATDAVKLLLAHPLLDPNFVELGRAYTPLFLAIKFGYLDILNLLLEHKDIEINHVFHNVNETPLSLAISAGRNEIIERLLEAGAK